MTQAQGELIGSEITRRLAVFQDAMTAIRQAAVEEAMGSVASQMAIEKAQLHSASEVMEARIMGTIGVAIDEHSNVLVEQFVVENVATRANVDELKVVTEAIGGDKFEAMASKMGCLTRPYSTGPRCSATCSARTQTSCAIACFATSTPLRS